MKIKSSLPITLHQYNLKWGINHISQAFSQGYEVTLEDGSIHWCPKALFDKLKIDEDEKITSPRLPITLA